MKTLFLIRHAKSSWDYPNLSDFDRPLNSRGMKDGPFMASLLQAKGVKPDKIVSSPANRALTTARFFAAAFHMKEQDIVQNRMIYEATPYEVLNIIRHLDNQWDTVFLFGHNPTFTDLANQFTKDYIYNVPTCGIVQMQSAAPDWAALDSRNTTVVNTYFPKDF